MNFSGHNAGVQQDAVAPHSATSANRTAPALSSGPACGSPAAAYISQAAARVTLLDARRASLALSQPRVAVQESETAEHDNQDGRRSEMFSGIMLEYSRMMLRPTPLQQPRLLQVWSRALRVANCCTRTLSSCGDSERDCRARFLIWTTGASRWTGFRRWPRCRSAVRFGAPLHHYSNPQDHFSFGPARCSCQPSARPACPAYSLSVPCCCDRERKFRL